MNEGILSRLAEITEEERSILSGQSAIDRNLYMDGSRDVITGDKLLAPGRLVTIRPHTRFVAFPQHTHDYVEMVYMAQGQTRHIVNGREILLKEGELLMLGQHALQEIAPAGERDLAVNFILIPGFFDSAAISLGSSNALAVFLRDNLAGRRQAICCLTCPGPFWRKTCWRT